MCRQCPGYRNEVGQLLFAAASNFWPGLQPPPVAQPPRAAAAAAAQGEGSSPAAVDQPSTSSDGSSGEHQNAAPASLPSAVTFTNVCVSFCARRQRLLRSTAAPLRATISSAPAASSRCLTDALSSTLSRLIHSNVSSSPGHTERLLPRVAAFI